MSTPENTPNLDELITEYIKLADAAPDEPNKEEDERMFKVFSQISEFPNGLEMLKLRITYGDELF